MSESPRPLYEQLSAADQDRVVAVYLAGSTEKDLASIFGLPYRSIGKLIAKRGVKRGRAETASLKIKSKLDDPEIITAIRELRNTKSLEEIAEIYSSSISAVHRLCKKYNISLPDNYNELQSFRMMSAWTEEKRAAAACLSYQHDTPEQRALISENSRRLWRDVEYRARQIEIQRRIWNMPENRERLAQMRANQSGSITAPQRSLYQYMTDLGIDYTPEYAIGPHLFDCFIPSHKLLIECQGDYWHKLEHKIRYDQAKATYVLKYLPEYTLKYIWEHEFFCQDRVIDTLKYWLGITQLTLEEFDFQQIAIKFIAADEYKPFLIRYHYTHSGGRGGHVYGAFLDDKLVAVCAFSSLIRQNIDTLEFTDQEAMELSRLCIHPNYQKHNFASWFVSRCLKLLDKNIRLIISYCDTTYNHDGAIYKALNFTQDSIIDSDYWYVGEGGWVMQKQTLYGRARKMSLTENEYAEINGYIRVYGKEKLRFIFRR